MRREPERRSSIPSTGILFPNSQIPGNLITPQAKTLVQGIAMVSGEHRLSRCLWKPSDYGYTDFAISATETHIFSPSALNEFRAAWVVHSSVRTGQNTDVKPWSLFP